MIKFTRYIILMLFAALTVNVGVSSSLLLISQTDNVSGFTTENAQDEEYQTASFNQKLFLPVQQNENRVLNTNQLHNTKQQIKANSFGTPVSELTFKSFSKQYFVVSKEIIAGLPTLDLLYPYHDFL